MRKAATITTDIRSDFILALFINRRRFISGVKWCFFSGLPTSGWNNFSLSEDKRNNILSMYIYPMGIVRAD